MATFAGKDGTVLIGSTAVGEITSFSFNVSANTADNTVMGDAWEGHTILQKKWDGSAECFWDDTDAGQSAMAVGTDVTLNLQPEGNTTGDFLYTGSATVESVATSQDTSGLVTASFTFKGNGALTESTVA